MTIKTSLLIIGGILLVAYVYSHQERPKQTPDTVDKKQQDKRLGMTRAQFKGTAIDWTMMHHNLPAEATK